jgi:uncharacterized membrane protein
MSDLIAIAYPDEATAMRARRNLWEGMEKGIIEVEDALVMIRAEDGTVDIRHGSSGVGAAAVGGAMWGGLIGLVLLAPLLGMAAGAAAGAAAWKHAVPDAGIAESFVTDLRQSLAPGSAALVLLVRKMTSEEVIPLIKERGHVIQTTLDEKLEEQLDAALSAGSQGTG